MRWLLVVLLAGCRFEHGARLGDASVTADTGDAPTLIDMATAPTCLDRWYDGTIRFDSPLALTALNSTSFDRDPFLTPDELTIYWSTPRAGGPSDVWTATRPSIASMFSGPHEAAEFNSTANDAKLSFSADGKIAVLSSDRSGSAAFDVWESIRTSTSQTFPAMNRTNVMMVETAGSEHDPMVSADGQHLYIAPDGGAPQRIVVATRGSNGVFAAPVPLTELAGGNGDGDPAPTPDERIILFASNRVLTGGGNGDIWYATRASTTAGFGIPKPVPDINSVFSEGDPHISNDGCRVYFARNVPGTDYDMFVASATP